jgi:hypothetical protein
MEKINPESFDKKQIIEDIKYNLQPNRNYWEPNSSLHHY